MTPARWVRKRSTAGTVVEETQNRRRSHEHPDQQRAPLGPGTDTRGLVAAAT
ncbi:hypothetical protein [Nonomuraea angiospora]